MKYLLIFQLIVLISCTRKYDKKNHKFTVNFCDYKPNGCTCNLYGEVYNIYGMGALGSDVNAEYLTDSVNFRVRLGIYDEGNEMIIVKCQGDTIKVFKTIKIQEKGDCDTLSKRIYSLRALKGSRHFE